MFASTPTTFISYQPFQYAIYTIYQRHTARHNCPALADQSICACSCKYAHTLLQLTFDTLLPSSCRSACASPDRPSRRARVPSFCTHPIKWVIPVLKRTQCAHRCLVLKLPNGLGSAVDQLVQVQVVCVRFDQLLNVTVQY